VGGIEDAQSCGLEEGNWATGYGLLAMGYWLWANLAEMGRGQGCC
jgi:hypothetical protein